MLAKPSAVIDTRVIYCGDNLDQLRKLPDAVKVPRVKL
jgi:lysyl-tRNA synthetase class I